MRERRTGLRTQRIRIGRSRQRVCAARRRPQGNAPPCPLKVTARYPGTGWIRPEGARRPYHKQGIGTHLRRESRDADSSRIEYTRQIHVSCKGSAHAHPRAAPGPYWVVLRAKPTRHWLLNAVSLSTRMLELVSLSRQEAASLLASLHWPGSEANAAPFLERRRRHVYAVGRSRWPSPPFSRQSSARSVASRIIERCSLPASAASASTTLRSPKCRR